MAAGHAHALYHHGDTPLHHLAPQVKIAAAFGIVFGVVVTPRRVVWAFVIYALVLVGLMIIARLPVGFVARRMTVEIPFLLVAILLPVFGTGEQVEILGVSLSIQGLWDAWNIVAKATLGLMTAVVLAATTQIPDMLKGLDSLRMPSIVTAIAGFMVRYVDVIADEFSRMRVAMVARGREARWASHLVPYAATFGAMFVRTYERGERVSLAMASRGYRGSMPASARISAPIGQWLTAGLVVGLVWLVAMTGWATQ